MDNKSDDKVLELLNKQAEEQYQAGYRAGLAAEKLKSQKLVEALEFYARHHWPNCSLGFTIHCDCLANTARKALSANNESGNEGK